MTASIFKQQRFIFRSAGHKVHWLEGSSQFHGNQCRNRIGQFADETTNQKGTFSIMPESRIWCSEFKSTNGLDAHYWCCMYAALSKDRSLAKDYLCFNSTNGKWWISFFLKCNGKGFISEDTTMDSNQEHSSSDSAEALRLHHEPSQWVTILTLLNLKYYKWFAKFYIWV